MEGEISEPFDLRVDRFQAGDQVFALRLRCPLQAPGLSILKLSLDRWEQPCKFALEYKVMCAGSEQFYGAFFLDDAGNDNKGQV